jgi:hypothetical protein
MIKTKFHHKEHGEKRTADERRFTQINSGVRLPLILIQPRGISLDSAVFLGRTDQAKSVTGQLAV